MSLKDTMLKLIETQWDKILLFVLVIYFTFFMEALLFKFPNLDAATLQWIEKSVDLAEGALIGAITTAAAMRQHTETTSTPNKVVTTVETAPTAGPTVQQEEPKE